MSSQAICESVCGWIGLTLRIASVAFVVCPAIANGAAYFSISNQQVIIGNDQVELVFSTTSGNLLNLTDKVTGHDFISEKQGGYSGFTFGYTTPTNTVQLYSNGGQARSVSLTPKAIAGGVQLTIQHEKFFLNGGTANLTATLSVTVDDVSPLTTWQLSMTNGEQLTIEQVAAPALVGLGQIGDDPSGDYLVYPSAAGILFQDPVHNFIPHQGWGNQLYPGGWQNMQFLAYYSKQSGTGLYMASQDSAGYAKTLHSTRLGNNWLLLDSTYLPPFQLGGDVQVPYPVVLGVFHGDWYDAADLYRSWALQQPWAQAGPLATRADVPDWYKQTGMLGQVTTNPGWGSPWGFSTLPALAADWQSRLTTPPLYFWWGWENRGPWMDPPDLLPPNEGWASFDSAVAGTHSASGRLMLGVTTGGASEEAPSWPVLRASASQKRDGSFYVLQSLAKDLQRCSVLRKTMERGDDKWKGLR
jgi:hypothetical protein